jgi:hypothetical protein
MLLLSAPWRNGQHHTTTGGVIEGPDHGTAEALPVQQRGLQARSGPESTAAHRRRLLRAGMSPVYRAGY